MRKKYWHWGTIRGVVALTVMGVLSGCAASERLDGGLQQPQKRD